MGHLSVLVGVPVTQHGFAFSAEEQERERVLDALASGQHTQVLAYLRRRLRERYPHQWVTADHCRRIMRDEGIELPNNNTLGALFRANGWVTDGVRIPSLTKGSHANRLLRWRHE